MVGYVQRSPGRVPQYTELETLGKVRGWGSGVTTLASGCASGCAGRWFLCAVRSFILLCSCAPARWGVWGGGAPLVRNRDRVRVRALHIFVHARCHRAPPRSGLMSMSDASLFLGLWDVRESAKDLA